MTIAIEMQYTKNKIIKSCAKCEMVCSIIITQIRPCREFIKNKKK